MSVFEKIDFSELAKLINELPPKLYSKLEEAHNRYEHLIGITSGEFSEEKIYKDRKEHPEFARISPIAWSHIAFTGKYNFRKNNGDIDVDAMVNELEKHLKRYFWKVT